MVLKDLVMMALLSMEHMDLKYFWAQGALRNGRFSLYKRHGETNLGDLMTKHVGMAKMHDLLGRDGFVFLGGRAPGAPGLADGAVQQRIAAILGCTVLGLGSQ